MPIHLPAPIDIYFRSENDHDAEALQRCFAADGSVRDEGRIFAGLAAIQSWRRAAAARYAHRTEPVRITERSGKVIVTALVSGDFPGSPVHLDHVFELAGDRIVSLEIG